ncbi:MAG: sigma-70 family RNA polymerase sigma factor [Phycisphaerae bacterium]|nr:sigma-70 family RNA polymerase sigma factor [Phycisphaerae bacterium]
MAQAHDPQPEDADELSRLLAAAAAGDPEAWREVVRRYARRVFALAKSRCRNNEVAEEVTQSVFATVAAKLGGGGYSERGRFEAWLFRVAMNRIRDQIRRRTRQRTPVDGAAALEDAAGSDTLPVDLSALRAAMDRLSEADREVVELRHHAGMGFREMSELLGEPLGTLLARHHRALRKLRGLLQGDDA